MDILDKNLPHHNPHPPITVVEKKKTERPAHFASKAEEVAYDVSEETGKHVLVNPDPLENRPVRAEHILTILDKTGTKIPQKHLRGLQDIAEAIRPLDARWPLTHITLENIDREWNADQARIHEPDFNPRFGHRGEVAPYLIETGRLVRNQMNVLASTANPILETIGNEFIKPALQKFEAERLREEMLTAVKNHDPDDTAAVHFKPTLLLRACQSAHANIDIAIGLACGSRLHAWENAFWGSIELIMQRFLQSK